MRRLPLPALAVLLLLANACGEKPEPKGGPADQILIHGHRGARVLSADDPRHAGLLAELDSLVARARPAAGVLSRRDVALAFERGALEFRFASAPSLRLAGGEERSPWRILLPLGVEPEPPGGERGVLLLFGYPEYEAHPLITSRGRDSAVEILEGR